MQTGLRSAKDLRSRELILTQLHDELAEHKCDIECETKPSEEP